MKKLFLKEEILMNSRKPVVKRVIAVLLTITLVMCLLPANNIVQAKSQKVKLSKKNITVMIGNKKTVKLKKAKKKVKWKIVAGKKNISIKKKGKLKNKLIVKGKKVGKAKIKAICGKKKYTLKVVVKKKKIQKPTTKPGESVSTNNSEVPTTTSKEPEVTTTAKEPEATTTEKTPEVTTTVKEPETTTPKATEIPTTKEFYQEPETEQNPKNVKVDTYFNKVDTASSTKVSTSASEGIENLFDGNKNTKMCTMDGFPLRISWQMDRATVLKKYTLTTANDAATYSYRNPKQWHLYGSNNGTSWTQIYTVTDSGIEAKNSQDYTYETDIQESYQYYLLQIESNGTNYYGFQLAEMSLYGDVSDANYEIGEDLSSYFESVYAAGTTVNGYSGEGVENLFDGSTSTKFFDNKKEFSISWKMKQPTTVYGYSLTTANDNEQYKGRNPKSWILYGSKDGNNWETIDVVNDSGMEDKNFKTYNYTVDKVGTYQYYKLDVQAIYGSGCQISGISMKGATVSPSKYDILFTGDWKDVTVDGYLEELTKLFYNSYPRLYQRWGNGTEPTTITFKADNNYDGVAYCQGTTVCVSTAYANSHPTDIGFFSHEITHSVQQYSGKLNYGDDVAWWTENMANYGGFRYFHWSNPKYVQVYEATDT